MRLSCTLLILAILTGCTTALPLPPSGQWSERTIVLGPVVVCKGGNFSSEPKGCNQWPLALAVPPSPEIHYLELKTKAAEQYTVDANFVVLRDVSVEYTTEINGIVRGWRAHAIAGKTVTP